MNKEEILEALAEKTGLSKAECKKVFEATFELAAKAMKKDEFKVAGFGTFASKKVAARTCVNPNTKEVVKVPAKVKPVFKPAKALKEKLG